MDTAGKLGGQGDAFRLGHGSPDGFGGGHEGLAVKLLLQGGAHLAQHGAGEAVGHDGFEAVAHFEAIAAVIDNQQQQDAFVLAFLADAPGAINRVGDVFDGLAFQGSDGH